MKNYFTYALLMLSAVATLSSCRDESKLPAPKIAASVPIIFPQISSDPDKNHYDIARARASTTALASLANPTRPVFEFTINFDNNRDRRIKAVEVYKSFLSGANFKDTGLVYSEGSFGPRVLVGTYSSFPTTISMSSQDALTDLQRIISGQTTLPYLLTVKGATPTTSNTLAFKSNTEAVVFTFEYIMDDDTKVILTPTNPVRVGPAPGSTTTPTTVQVVSSSAQVNTPLAAIAVFRP